MQLKDIKKGDIVTYKNGNINYVNKPTQYYEYFYKDFNNKEYRTLDIVKIQRYVKFLWFYRLKTIYKRKRCD